MVLEPTWLESPDIQDFRTGFKSSLAPQQPCQNDNFLSPLTIKKMGLMDGRTKYPMFLLKMWGKMGGRTKYPMFLLIKWGKMGRRTKYPMFVG